MALVEKLGLFFYIMLNLSVALFHIRWAILTALIERQIESFVEEVNRELGKTYLFKEIILNTIKN